MSTNPAAIPTSCPDSQGDDRWMSQHNFYISNSKGREPDVLFVGDSLVQQMHLFEVWREFFSPLHALNFGIGGDQTQHVLWRLLNGALDHISPKVVVLWVGTNNHGHTPEQISGGIMAIVQVINQKLPKCHTLVMSLLPRGKNHNILREKNGKVNKLVQQALASIPYASYYNVDHKFVQSHGNISHHEMYDYLHLTPQAYRDVCKPLHAAIKQLLEAPRKD